ncbi:MAG: hypothetical protein GEV28_15800 [Actinophytocola sp.]|uniref:phosphate signaling complex PhoU family protein n=1 Tax=Actinophytocola sp. TaxID=1872138 RepID=UPI001324637F|nr:PhoU domain-containing protein [Actinophytocola sp.]MPZ81781.1 hypothetical protein [Actinophytocola sp.]
MREKFHEELDQLATRLGDLASLVADAMRRAMTALLDVDARLADVVGDGAVAALQSEVDAIAVDILARQQPVATDLRTVVACLRMSVDLRRMGKLAVHVAEIASAHQPDCAVPAELRPAVQAMVDHAQRIVAAAGRAVMTRDGTAVTGLEREDAELGRLQKELLPHVVRPAAGARRRACGGRGADRPVLRTLRRPRVRPCPSGRLPRGDPARWMRRVPECDGSTGSNDPDEGDRGRRRCQCARGSVEV